MTHRIHRSQLLPAVAAAVAFGIGIVAPAALRAQTLSMDMSWGIQHQVQNWNHSQAAAAAAAANYLRTMQQMRAAGYTGPSLPTGVTPESLRHSINGANAAWSSYNDAQRRNSAQLSQAQHNYVMQAIRGCYFAVNAYGQSVYTCP